MRGAQALNGSVEGNVFTWLPYSAARSFEAGVANTLLAAYLLAHVPEWLVYSHLGRHRRGHDAPISPNGGSAYD